MEEMEITNTKDCVTEETEAFCEKTTENPHKSVRGLRFLKYGIVFLLCVFFVFTLLFYWISIRMGDLPSTEEIKRFEKLPYYSNGKFTNMEPSIFNTVKILKSSNPFRFMFSHVNAPKKPLPKQVLTKASFSEKPDAFSVRWLGHSTVIFELAGRRFMTDPVFSNAAPIPGVLRRYGVSPLDPANLPSLDFILISHDHYDHLDYTFIKKMHSWEGSFIVPLGLGARLRSWGIAQERIIELGWDGSVNVSGILITAVQSRHFSGRSWNDRYQTLWTAFIIEAEGKKIFFGADGGYGSHFESIGKMHGPFDLVCLEIDAWNERWPNNHLFPSEIPKAFADLKGKLFLPIHWGVFDMAMHKWDDSIKAIIKEAETHAIPLITPIMGEEIRLNLPLPPNLHWWEQN